MRLLPKKNKKAEVYIGVVVAVGILVMLSQAIVFLTISIYDFSIVNQVRSTAKNIAQEELETIRNAPYQDIGTVGGIPSGLFPQEQNVSSNGQSFTVRTRINYIDDPFDGTAPDDSLPTDYKRIRVDVSWGGIHASNVSTITMVSDIAPKGVETTEGGGTLSVLVFDANAAPVGQAEVFVSAPELDPPISATYYTNDTGIITVPGAPACNSCYQITVSKDGFSSDRTYSTQEVANPIKPHASVIEGQLTQVSFSIDLFSSLTIETLGSKENGFDPLPNQVIRLRGDKIIGTDSSDQNVYKYDYDVVTNTSARLTIEELEWDNYHFLTPDGQNFDVAYTNPPYPISLTPTQNLTVPVSIVQDSQNSLHAQFLDDTSSLIASVSATLKDAQGFEENIISATDSAAPDFGQVFFEELEDKNYTLIATASGFLESITQIDISGDNREIVIMQPE